MKNVGLLALFQFMHYFPGKAQVICVLCFEQNEEVSSGVNNLLLNGGFENTSCAPGWFEDCFCPNSLFYNCDLSNWTCIGGGTNSYPSVFDSTLSFIPEGNNAAYFGNGSAYTCSEAWGDSTCQSIKSCIVTGIPTGFPKSDPGYGELTGVSLEQTVSGLIVGQTYVLEFWAGGEPFFGPLSGQGIFALDVGFGKIFLECNDTAPDFPFGTRYLVVFNAIATSHQIKFTNWGHICGICTELVLDDVRLYTIEELSGTVPDCMTATSNVNENEDICIYPNPFSSELTVITKLSIRSAFTLYDLVSKPVFHQEFINTLTINTCILPDGIYFYSVNDKNGVLKSGKIVKE
ncbi:MAG TPA: T9SS type A sorting domain-containing protein [Saprospiraceae bacterium]|nr:T9SS type A sorting domain-containing protein [Saprospiraceae bacterium]